VWRIFAANKRNQMIRVLITAFSLSLAVLCFAQEKEIQNFHIGIVYPISSNGLKALEYQNKVSLHAFGGLSGGELGLCLSGFGHITVGNLRGLQASGFGNIVNGKTNGMLAAGFANIGSNVQGMMAAGFANISTMVNGMQAAGFGNIATQITGMQAAGFGNIGSANRGFQGAGFGNITTLMTGFQAAGFGNIAGQINGMQAAGFINIAGDVKGIQAAGFINIANKVKGFQVAGFINIADSSDYPIGIINIVGNGEKFIQAYTDELSSYMLSFRSGGRYTYGFIGAGINSNTHFRDDTRFITELGLGGQLIVSANFRIRGEIFTSSFNATNQSALANRSGARLIADANYGRLHIFAGSGLSYLRIRNAAEFSHPLEIFKEPDYTGPNRWMLGLMGGVAVRI